jgi:hypothetical protein
MNLWRHSLAYSHSTAVFYFSWEGSHHQSYIHMFPVSFRVENEVHVNSENKWSYNTLVCSQVNKY